MMADDFTPNKAFFDSILRSAGVRALVDQAAERTLSAARTTAPVDTHAYRNALHIEHRASRYRDVAEVVGSDEKTMLIESITGNLARAVKAAKK